MPVLELVGLHRRQEADLAEVDREHRHAGARVARAARAGSCRRRRARRRGRRRRRRRRVERDAAAGSRPCLLVSSGRGAASTPASRRQLDAAVASAGAVSSGRRCVKTVTSATGAHGSTSRAAGLQRPRRAPARARPRRASTNVSRLPFGPGQARGREAEHRRAERRAPPRPTATSAAAAGAGVAHHAALADPLAADLELRLDQRQAVEARRRAAPAPRAAPWPAR